MKKLAVFYHTFLFRGIPPVQSQSAVHITREQILDAMTGSGLLDACEEFHIGINGGEESRVLADTFMPKKAQIMYHGLQSRSEFPTMYALQQWIPGHEDWYVCYFQAKGATYPYLDPFGTIWRHCMQKNVINDWRKCVKDMDDGYESVGAHWLTPEAFPGMVGRPFWGGNFWWATAKFLMELPALPKTSDNYYLSEAFIGTGRCPKVRDYAPHWPNWQGCGATTGHRL